MPFIHVFIDDLEMTESDSYLETFEKQEYLEYLSNLKQPLDSYGHFRRPLPRPVVPNPN